jgi:hypothetical protein
MIWRVLISCHASGAWASARRRCVSSRTSKACVAVRKRVSGNVNETQMRRHLGNFEAAEVFKAEAVSVGVPR